MKPLPIKWRIALSPPPGKPESPLYWTVQMGHETYRAVWEFIDKSGGGILNGRRINLLICHPIGHVADHLAIFLETIAVVGLLIIVLAVALTLFTIEWGLRPITSLTQRMDQISGKHLHRPAPLLLQGVPELRSFVQAWNRMLERLALAMQQQRRFTADASHELRTPLAIVKSTLQCARTRKRSVSSYETCIDQSLEDLARLEHLIEQLLMLARLDDTSTQDEHSPVDVGQVVRDVCEHYADFVDQRGNALKWNTCRAVVMGHYDQLQQLISNLLDNAIKFGPPGHAITVHMACSGAIVQVCVHDEGGGVPTGDQRSIFDRFYRIRNTGPHAPPGSGLGLALAREFAIKHHGTIQVESHPDTGTSFTVTLSLSHSHHRYAGEPYGHDDTL